MWIAKNWQDFEVIDCGDGEKLERWGEQLLVRPDPQAIWAKTEGQAWDNAHAYYSRSTTGGGSWEIVNLPNSWRITYGKLVFQIKPMNFKHTGLFPEQAANWDFAADCIEKADRPVSVLNLFAYTGGATLAAAAAGAKVCHVDAAKGMVAHAKENARLSGLGEAPIRWIVDDCKKFLQREIRRGVTYDGLIMDPPSYGRGPTGEIWKIEEDITDFISLAVEVLSDRPLFVIINSYTTGLAPSVMGYILARAMEKRFGGQVESKELGLPVSATGLALPCGATTRWQSSEIG